MTVLELGLILLIAGAALVSADAHDFSVLWRGWSPDVWSAARAANALVVAIFIFWGWDVIFNLAEETRSPARSSARAGFLALALLTVVFVFFAALVAATLSPADLQAGGGNVLFALADKLLPKPLGTFVVLAFLVSVIGGIEAAIVSFSRTLLANARDGRLPALLGRLHGRTQTPAVAVIFGSALALALLIATVASQTVDEAISASINATGIIVAIYYGLAAIACAVYFWRKREAGMHRIPVYVVWPLAAAAIFFAAAMITLSEASLPALSVVVAGMTIGLCVLAAHRNARSPRPIRGS